MALRSAALGFAVMALTGCAASISTHVQEPIQPSGPADVEVLAIMPGIVESGSEWVRPQTMESLVLALRERFPEIEILPPDEVARRLAVQSRAQDYAALLHDFERAGVVDAERVEEILGVLEASHFLHIHAGYGGEGLQRVTTFLDGSPLYYSTKRQALYAVATLWGPNDHGPSWEAVARAESQGGPLSRDREPSDLVEPLVMSVVEEIPLAGSGASSVSDARAPGGA